jgi:hypothetical protein
LLPQEQKVLIFLVGLEGMDYATAAQVVGVPSPPFDHAGAKNFDLDGHKTRQPRGSKDGKSGLALRETFCVGDAFPE